MVRTPTKSQVVSQEVISPAEAEKYLETMPGNRPLRQSVVDDLVRQAKDGDFFNTVAPIHFDIEGRLRNGQHRMWMVIESGVPQEFMVIRGLTEAEIDALDTGARRTGGDVLTLGGTPHGKAMAAALHSLWNYEHGYFPGYTVAKARPSITPLNNHMMREFAGQRPNMSVSTAYVVGQPSLRRLAPQSLMIFCHYIICEASSTQGPEFFRRLIMGVYNGASDPIYHIRTRLEKGATGTSRQDKLGKVETCALIIKAWNAWVQGRPVQLLRWVHGGNKPEAFPRPMAASQTAAGVGGDD